MRHVSIRTLMALIAISAVGLAALRSPRPSSRPARQRDAAAEVLHDRP